MRCALTSRGPRARERRGAIRRAWSFARGALRRRLRRGDGRCCLPASIARLRGKAPNDCCGTLAVSDRERSHALALQLLNRYGVLLREHVAAENVPGGFSAVYDVLKALEESGRIRRGYFVGGLGATQFALPAAVDLLRQLRTEPPAEKPEFVQLAATDPANPYGSVLRWPDLPVADEDSESAPRILTRAAYAEVILRNGQLVAWLKRGNPNLLVFLPAEEPERSQAAAGLAHFLCARGQERMRASNHEGVLITTINGQPVAAHSDGALPDGCGLSSRAAGDASAAHSAGDWTRRIASARGAIAYA